MRAFILIILALFFSTHVLAQGTTRVQVEDNEDLQAALKNDVYRFPTFQTGKVYLPNGRSQTALLNLNLLTDQIQFIDEHQDTLTILSPDALSHVEIDTSKFVYYNNGFLEMLQEYGHVLLAVSQKLKIADIQKEGAYGSKNSAASIASIGTGFTDKLRYTPKVYDDMLINLNQAFYLLDKEANVSLVNKRNVQKAFPEHKAEISAFIKEHKTNFKQEQDIRLLLTYINAL